MRGGNRSHAKIIIKILVCINALYQSAALPSRLNYDTDPVLQADWVLPDKPVYLRWNSIQHCRKSTHHKSLDSISSKRTSQFVSDSTPLLIDACAIEGLTGYNSDFIPGTYEEIEPRVTEINTCSTAIIGQGTSTCSVVGDNGYARVINALISYAPPWVHIFLSLHNC